MPSTKKKILLIRFGAIGDIVLTTSVIRCLKLQRPDLSLHFATKRSYASILQHNPYIDQLHCYEGSFLKLMQSLRKEQFDWVIDLHNNHVSWVVKCILNVSSFSVNKIKLEKSLMVAFKWNRLPALHITDRFFQTVQSFGVKNDGKGMEYFIHEQDQVDIGLHFPICPQTDGNFFILNEAF